MSDAILADLVEASQRRGSQYADARRVEREHQSVSVKDGLVEAVERSASRGIGLRLLRRGAWGFAATDRVSEAALGSLVAEAIARADASANVRRVAVRLAPQAPQRGGYRTPVRRDPFVVPLEERVELLRAANERLRGPNARSRRSSVSAFRTRKRLVTSEGTDVEQEIVETAAGLSVVAVKAGSKPASRSDMRNARQAGWEFIEEQDLPHRAASYRDDAEAIIAAPLVEARPTTVILDQPFLALLVHESCGHPTESDRILEHEVAFAGTSFMWPADLGTLRYGSDSVSITADATAPGGMGTFGWDDDGVPATRTPIIDRGTFVGYLTSRETAGALGLPASGGSARAEGWQHFPIVRMVNVSLEPGGRTLADLIGDVDDGLLLRSPASYSLDDKRQNFHFTAQVAQEIRNGEVQGHVRGVGFQSLTPAFWGRCDAVADDWELNGFLSCAKGEPLQLIRVGHGAPHARFRDLPIEVMP